MGLRTMTVEEIEGMSENELAELARREPDSYVGTIPGQLIESSYVEICHDTVSLKIKRNEDNDYEIFLND